MKTLIASMLLLSGVFAQAGTTSINEKFMTKTEQTSFIEEESKGIRRDLWQNGYEDVSSSSEWMSRKALSEYFLPENVRRYEDSLEQPEVTELFICNARANCEVYLVSVSSNYWGGYGVESHFVMLYTESQKSYTHSHVVYAE